jgi:hypothetical protein
MHQRVGLEHKRADTGVLFVYMYINASVCVCVLGCAHVLGKLREDEVAISTALPSYTRSAVC